MTTASGLVEIHGVTKRFGDREVLRGIDLRVEPGQVLAIIGPSGSGKSTLLRSINHLETIDGGSITIDGEFLGYDFKNGALHERRDRDVRAARSQVGMVFQQFNLFANLTAIENVAEAPVALGLLSKGDARARARTLLERVGLSSHEDHYPRQLSGGQQQRVAIARALATEPKVLLFDEPTSALDPELVGEVLAVIRELATQGTTLIIVTHEIGFAREVADKIAFVDAGLLVEYGTPAEVLDSPENARTQSFLAKVLA